MKDTKRSSKNVQNYKLTTGKSKVVTYGHQVIMLKALGALTKYVDDQRKKEVKLE